MTLMLVVVFMITLIYMATAGRLISYVKLLAIQGIVLFGLAYLELHSIDPINLTFILIETLGVKGIAIPLFLVKLINRNHISRETEANISAFSSLLAMTLGIALSFALAYRVSKDTEHMLFLTGALSSVFAGIFLIVLRRKIITHIMGYMVLENGIFMLSLAVGSAMPMAVNAGILLDILTSVLVLGVFVNRIGDRFQSVEIEQLAKLRD